MPVSAFDLYSIGIGPSSSHTVGPMRAARRFAFEAPKAGRVRAELFGSLGATGRGHHSDTAVLLGLGGEDPATVRVAGIPERVGAIRQSGTVRLAGDRPVPVEVILPRRRSLPHHPNGMTFTAWNRDGSPLAERTFYSVGGGFVVEEGEEPAADTAVLPFPFASGADLLAYDRPLSEVMLENERVWRTDAEVRAGLLGIWRVMRGCAER